MKGRGTPKWTSHVVRHRDLDGRLDEEQMRVSEMHIRKKLKKKIADVLW